MTDDKPQRRPKQERLFDGGAPGKVVARMRRELDVTVRALRSSGRLETVDSARIALARTLAELVDAEVSDVEPSRYVAGILAGRLRDAIGDLHAVGGPTPAADGLDLLFDAVTAALPPPPG